MPRRVSALPQASVSSQVKIRRGQIDRIVEMDCEIGLPSPLVSP
jgi:hypothetical protein